MFSNSRCPVWCWTSRVWTSDQVGGGDVATFTASLPGRQAHWCHCQFKIVTVLGGSGDNPFGRDRDDGRYLRQAVQMRTYEIPLTHVWLGAAAVKSRFSESPARRPSSICVVVRSPVARQSLFNPGLSSPDPLSRRALWDGTFDQRRRIWLSTHTGGQDDECQQSGFARLFLTRLRAPHPGRSASLMV